MPPGIYLQTNKSGQPGRCARHRLALIELEVRPEMILLTAVIVASVAAHWRLTRWLNRPLTPTDRYCARVDAEADSADYARDAYARRHIA